ncbi:MAG: A24 family peptidase [Clostridiales bacterium]|nr:A24 family peptidase [Clostridiales bacterium]
MVQSVLTGVVLVICSYTDIKSRKIYKSVIGVHLALALILHLAFRDLTWLSILLGIVPGLGCILLSALSKESMGYGDAFLIFSCGFSLGTDRVLAMLFTSFFCVGIWALWLVCFRHGKKKTAIPFVPFLLMGEVIQGLGALVL